MKRMERPQPRDKTERAPRSFWFDPRFGIGLALVVASILGVLALVSSADRTVEVWTARSPLVPGDTVDAGDLVLSSVRLGESDALYLPRDRMTDDGLVVTRAVAAGELVPASAVGRREGVRVASIVVAARDQLPQSVAAGSVVDLWSARETEAGVFGPPSVLVGSATVVRVLESDGLIVDGSTVGVEVLVPRTRIALVLEALANDDAIALVPASLPIGD